MIRDDEDGAGTRYFFKIRGVDKVQTDAEGFQGVLQKLMRRASSRPPIIYLCQTIESEYLLDNSRQNSWLKR
jgi:hypothetical protein